MSAQYLRDVVSLELDGSICTGCGKCAQVCPHGVFSIDYNRAQIIEKDACMECGACARNCPTGAVKVKAGVGCAAGVINGYLRGTEPTCDCGGEGSSSCCST